MKKRVICFICAFDCELTVEAAMRSVQNQTYDNWLCVVLSNGNRNSAYEPNWTYDVIKKFAAKDRRFIVVNKRKNSIDMYPRMLFHLAKCYPDSYICSLDADDEYSSDFFERAVSLAEEHDLDVVACGTELILKERAGGDEKALLSRRQINENMIIRKEDYTNQFLAYKPFLNEIWGKLYRASLLAETEDRKDNYFKIGESLFVSDSLFVLDLLKRSSAIGILSGTSHKFYHFEIRKASNATNVSSVSNHRSVINRFTKFTKLFRLPKLPKLTKLFKSTLLPIYKTYNYFLSFLNTYGDISDELYEYMQAILFGWFNDFYARVLLQVQSEQAFAKLVSKLVFDPKFDELMCYKDSGKYNNLRDYKKRKEFCTLLYHLSLCQKGVRNNIVRKKDDQPCSLRTRRELDRVAAKLEATIETLSKLQEENNYVGSIS